MEAPTMYAYVGSRTTRERNARGDGISVFAVRPSGALELVQVLGDLVNPSYLVLDRHGAHLYCVHGDRQEASAFAIDRATGRLSLLNTQSTEGRNPVHLSLDRQGRHLVVTNHLGPSLAVLPVLPDGSLGPLLSLTRIDGPPGPHRIEQPHAKPHLAEFDRSGAWLAVPDKGLDRVFVYTLDDAGRLRPAEPACTAAREGAGPRHLVFHPRLPRAYVVNELDSTVTTYAFDAVTGRLRPLQILPTLPSDFTGNSRAAGIAIAEDGRSLYASNRGHDSLACFRVDEDGLLAFVEAVPSQGRTPRHFSIAPGGETLYVLNEDSDSIVAFELDPRTCRIGPARSTVACGSPVCMVFSRSGVQA